MSVPMRLRARAVSAAKELRLPYYRGVATSSGSTASGAAPPVPVPCRMDAKTQNEWALFAAGACLLAIGGATTTGLLHEQLTPPPARAEPSLPRVRQPRWDKRKYSYVIIGSGTTASAAIESILLMQPDAKILLIAREQSSVPSDVLGPFEKGELQLGGDLLHSFNEWRRHITSRFINDSPHGTGPVDVIHQNNLTIDVEGHRVSLGEDCSGGYVFYDKCLVATTGKPRKLYVLDSERSRQQLTDSINTLHDLEDFEVLETLMDEEKIKHVTVIGGGFLGSEVALALAKRGAAKNVEVSQVYAEQCPMQRLLPPYLAQYMRVKLDEAGVSAIKERLVTDMRFDVEKGRLELVLQGWDKQSLATDYIVLASTHIEPDVEVARRSGLEIDKDSGGIVVNGQLEAVGGVFAAGGVASYFDPALGRRRIDRYDHSVNSGLLAGYNMAAAMLSARAHVTAQNHPSMNGEDISGPPGPQLRMYTHQPMLRSDLTSIDVVIEGLGEIDARLRTVGMWVDKTGSSRSVPASQRAYRRGVVYYLRGDKIVGILLWNTTDLLERAREVIRQQPKIASMSRLKGQIPLAPDDWLRIEETPGKVQYGNEVLTPPF